MVTFYRNPFWLEYIGYNCLCSAEQLTDAEAEDDPMYGKQPPKITIPEDFSLNPGKDKSTWDN